MGTARVLCTNAPRAFEYQDRVSVPYADLPSYTLPTHVPVVHVRPGGPCQGRARIVGFQAATVGCGLACAPQPTPPPSGMQMNEWYMQSCLLLLRCDGACCTVGGTGTIYCRDLKLECIYTTVTSMRSCVSTIGGVPGNPAQPPQGPPPPPGGPEAGTSSSADRSFDAPTALWGPE